ncbi:hypothetical protein B0H14DRAFT_3494363 [Mycena olivaceomarginata]|nr:hypothetical protein B0H14DRAFT_3494363 [Mycena olivaceomarginata]
MVDQKFSQQFRAGRVALVAGGNAGLRYTAVVELARQGAKVYVSSAQIEFLAFDLISLRATKTTAEEFLEGEAPGYTGVEGHFALALLLLRHIASLPDAHGRVVTLSSEGHRATEPRLF